jgi:glycosyltransferase involved in cell wall biosynthesis
MLTVLFATRNGAMTLPAVLTAYQSVEAPPGGWKLVVIDNGSTDTSREILTRFQRHLPLTHIVELSPGKNAALNAGLSLVEGDLVVLTDDDALPRPDWLVRLREAADQHGAFAIFGGTVTPRWETNPPNWILDWVPLGPTYTVSDPNLHAGPVEGYYIFGPNMAVRTRLFEAGLQFDPLIGPSRSPTYAMGSETEFVLRALSHGERAWFVPLAVVEHVVSAFQMQFSWIIRRSARFGRGQCRLRRRFPSGPDIVWGLRHPELATPRFFGVPSVLIYQIIRKVGSVILALLLFSRRRLFRSAWALGYLYGYSREAASTQLLGPSGGEYDPGRRAL